MTRRLPWKRSSDEATLAPASSPLRRVKAEIPDLPSHTPSYTRPSVREKPLRRSFIDSSDPIRSPSTSPPPDLPREESMRPDDDRYRMVEDELLRVAQRFTTHLHRAEYERLKAHAKKQNAATIREIERPVFGTPTNEARRRRDRVARGAKQREVLKSTSHGTDASSASSGLRGLLETPKQDVRAIALDLPLQTPQRPPTVAGPSTSSPLRRAVAAHRAQEYPRSPALSRLTGRGDAQGSPRQSAFTQSSPLVQRHSSRVPVDTDVGDDEIDSDDPFGLTQRRMRRKQSREQFKSNEKTVAKEQPSDIMPSFL